MCVWLEAAREPHHTQRSEDNLSEVILFPLCDPRDQVEDSVAKRPYSLHHLAGPVFSNGSCSPWSAARTREETWRPLLGSAETSPTISSLRRGSVPP